MAQTWVELTLILTRAVGSYNSGPTDDGTLKSRSTIPRSKMSHPELNISYIAGLKDHCGLQMASEVTVDLSELGRSPIYKPTTSGNSPTLFPGQQGNYENQYCHNGPVESKCSFVVITLCNYEIITPSPLGLWV